MPTTVQLCCLRISFNEKVFQLQTHCVTHTVCVPNVKYTVNMTLFYSVCTKSDQITLSSGVTTTAEDKGVLAD